MEQPSDIIVLRKPEQMQTALDNHNGVFGTLSKPLFVIAEWPGRATYAGFPCAGHIPAYADSIGEAMQVIEAFTVNSRSIRVTVMPESADDTFMMALQDRVSEARIVPPNRLRATLG